MFQEGISARIKYVCTTDGVKLYRIYDIKYSKGSDHVQTRFDKKTGNGSISHMEMGKEKEIYQWKFPIKKAFKNIMHLTSIEKIELDVDYNSLIPAFNDFQLDYNKNLGKNAK